jgi:hypothetical protein
MIPVTEFIENGGDLSKVSISHPDLLMQLENPDEFNLGYVARNPKNHQDLWYVAKKYFDDNLEEVEETSVMRSASEVLSRLEGAEKELVLRNSWYEREEKNYEKQTKFWPTADDENMREAFDALSETKNEIALLKWVLNLE